MDTISGAGGCGPTVALTPDAAEAYVENYCGNSISIIDTRTRTLVTTLNTNTPIGAAFSAGGAFVFIANNNCPAFPCTVPGTVSVLDTANSKVEGSVTVGSNPQDIVIIPRFRHPPARVPAFVSRATQHALGRPSARCPICR
jgi:YVTN family beta-propeller protein